MRKMDCVLGLEERKVKSPCHSQSPPSPQGNEIIWENPVELYTGYAHKVRFYPRFWRESESVAFGPVI